MKSAHVKLDHRFLLRFSFLLILVGVTAALLFTNELPAAEAAISLSLGPGQKLVVLPNACNLAVLGSNASRVKVACDAWTPVPTPTATPTMDPNQSVLAFTSQTGDWIGLGQSYRYTSSDSQFTASLDDARRIISISVQQDSFTHWWYLYFAAPEGSQLTTGIYENATRWPFQDSAAPGLSLSGDGRGCNTLTGRFQILEADYTPDGYIQRFHATFEQHCEGGPAALFGEVQIVNPPPTPTPTATEIPTTAPDGATDARSPKISTTRVSVAKADAPDRKRVLTAGQLLKIQANGCRLKVTSRSVSKVVVVCQTLPTPTPTKGAPTATPLPGGPDGKWAGKTTNQGLPVRFNVTDNRTKFNSFYAEIYWVECLVKITGAGPYALDGDKLQIGVAGLASGSLTFVGTFTSNSNMDGVMNANSATITGCGTIDGQGGWNAKWVGNLSPQKASESDKHLRVVELKALPQ